MRLFLDACVLYPLATREILLSWAKAGGFTPLFSDRVVEEWALASRAKMGEEAEMRARGDAALMRAAFPDSMVSEYEAREAGLAPLPDAADTHVLAAALEGGADALLTFNIRDFPLKILRPLGLGRLHPDEYLSAAFRRDGQRFTAALAPFAEMAAGRGVSFRKFLKRAELPRLGKAWEQDQEGIE